MLEVGKLVVTPPTLQGVWGRGGGGDPPYPRRCAGGVVTYPTLEGVWGGEVVVTPPTLEGVREVGRWW